MNIIDWRVEIHQMLGSIWNRWSVSYCLIGVRCTARGALPRTCTVSESPVSWTFSATFVSSSLVRRSRMFRLVRSFAPLRPENGDLRVRTLDSVYGRFSTAQMFVIQNRFSHCSVTLIVIEASNPRKYNLHLHQNALQIETIVGYDSISHNSAGTCSRPS